MTVEDTFFCARHASVETGLRCGRCETPICPKCTVFTDVGARCPDCAPARKLPQFELGPIWIARGLGAALVAGAVAGAAWGFLLPDVVYLFAIFVGIGIGYVIGEATSLATNRKVGPVLQSFAVIGAILAYFVRNIVAPEFSILPSDDVWGLATVGAAAISAIGRLRF